MDNPGTQKYISLCSGYEGLGLGLEQTGGNFQPVVYVEIEAFAVTNLVAKIEENKLAPAPIWTDLKTFNSRAFRRKVHGIIGGYPCQPFSVAGNQLGESDPRHLWPDIKRHIENIEPEWCFFENVANHINIGLDKVVRDLQQMGYIVEAGIFSAEEVGAAHQRKRLFILAYSTGSQRNTRTKEQGVLSEVPRDRAVCNNLNGSGTGEELAYTNNKRPQRWDSGIMQERTSKCVARPGNPQHEWEEPRTIEPGLGRAVDGFASRVDELRLLGNGVYPETAAKAWIILNQRILL